MVGTTNRSMAAMSGAWLRKKVRHPWLGGPRRLTMYLATLGCAISNPRLGQNFSAWSGPSRKTDPAAHDDGLSQSCRRWRSPLSLVGGIGRAPRFGIPTLAIAGDVNASAKKGPPYRNAPLNTVA